MTQRENLGREIWRLLKEFAALAILLGASILVIDGCMSWLTSTARAGFNASPQPWDSTFENDPDNTDSVSLGDDHLRQIKQEARGRLETEHAFGTASGVGSDDGRHHEGAARAFFATAAPTAIAVADDDSSTALDEGRLWFDSDNENLLTAYDGSASAFENVNIKPESTDAGAAAAPTLTLYRNSASPADADIAGLITFSAEDSAGNEDNYASIQLTLDDVTSTTEDGQLDIRTMQAGTLTTMVTMDTTFAVANSTGFTVTAGGLVSSLVGYDVIGAVDMDMGSADVTDFTVITDGGTVVIDGSILMAGDLDMATTGNRIDLDTDNDTSIRASADDTIVLEALGEDFATFTNTGILDVTFVDNDATASGGPALRLHRDSASPAVNDFLGSLRFNGENDASTRLDYAVISALIADPANATGEDGQLRFNTMQAGSSTLILTLDTGIVASASIDVDTGSQLTAETRTRSQATTSTLTAQDCRGSLVDNDGAAGSITFTLPAAAAGLTCIILDNDTSGALVVDAAAGDQIQALTNAAGDSITSDNVAGSMVSLIAVDNVNWWPMGTRGVWTDSN